MRMSGEGNEREAHLPRGKENRDREKNIQKRSDPESKKRVGGGNDLST